MLAQKITIDNLKCGGCANSIRTAISKIDGVEEVHVNVETSEVEVLSDESLAREEILNKLSSMGYPEQGAQNNLGHKAKSYVSCMIGRMSPEESN